MENTTMFEEERLSKLEHDIQNIYEQINKLQKLFQSRLQYKCYICKNNHLLIKCYDCNKKVCINCSTNPYTISPTGSGEDLCIYFCKLCK
jgi:hypothetical protein